MEARTGASLVRGRPFTITVRAVTHQSPPSTPASSAPRAFDHLGLDVRYALRSLRRSPAFVVIAVATLALGVACVTAAFSVIDTVLIRGLPYRNAGELATIYERNDAGALRVPSFPTFQDWEQAATSVSDAIEGMAFVRGDAVLLPGDKEEPERRIAAYVTPGFFSLLGTRPILGRTFAPEEERMGAPPVAVISYDLFMRRFGGDSRAIGALIPIDSVPTTVVGVMPRSFGYPNFAGAPAWFPPSVWQPIAVFQATHESLSLRGLHVDSRAVVRLRTGVDSLRAVTAMRTIQQRLAVAYPAEQAHWTSVDLRPMSDELFGSLRSTLTLVSAAIGLVMVLACANIANLVLVRASARSRELALRSVLGANGWRIARQSIVETLVVASAAGVLGAALATMLVGFVRRYADGRLPFADAIAVNSRALLFALGAATATALLVGLLPSLYTLRSTGRLMERLRSGATAAIGGAGERRARNVLVSLQFALAFTMLIGAGLLLQSIRRVMAAELGFDPTNVITFAVAPTGHAYDAPGDAAGLYRRILDAARAVPGVELAAAAGGALIPTRVDVAGRPADATPLLALYHPASEDYQRAMRIPVVAGRWFTESDMRSPAGFVINQRLARRLWADADPIGKAITTYRASQARADFGQPITLPVIGVVGDVRQNGREQDPQPELFLPYTLEVWPWMNFVVRSGNPSRVLRELETAVRRVDPAIEFRGTPSVLEMDVSPTRRFVTTVLAGFALGALLLAATGLYGMVAYGVLQRTREVGIRIALGAQRGRIIALVLRDGARWALGGVVVGLFGAYAATRLLQSMLFETEALDVATFVAVPVVLATVALLASYLPARRASRTDPLVAMRSD